MSDPIARLNAALEGRYVIERELGEGGMATVYLADDIKHERKVALKVLKPELAAVVGAERFLAEIKTTANLTHPHILPLFDSGEADGFLFYVMPHIEGESLRERIDREKQLPVDEAVKIATDLAEALDYAHRHKIIHRDIKPANILIHERRPLIADFGIALAVGAAGSNRLTETGLSLGTPYYMSPEQATGDQIVGASTDTYALGSVLYEMLVGEPPYPGTTAQAVLGRIIAGERVSAAKHRPSVPPNVDAAIRKALEKLPADRFTSAQEFARALGDVEFRHGGGLATTATEAAGHWRRLTVLGWGVAGLFALAFGWAITRAPPPQALARFELPLPEELTRLSTPGTTLDFSPDGSRLAFVARDGEQDRLWLRRLEQLTPVPIPGTDGGRNPRFSPDGGSLAFTSGGRLLTVALDGGEPRTLVGDSVNNRTGGVAWASNGTLFFTRANRDIWRVSERGGEPEQVTFVEDGEIGHYWPEVLPNGSDLLFTRVLGFLGDNQLAVVSLETGEQRDLSLPGEMARYSGSGHLVYSASRSSVGVGGGAYDVLAAPFDTEHLELTGAGQVLAEGVNVTAASASGFAVSSAGALAYLPEDLAGGWMPVWVSRDGSQEPLDPRLDPGPYYNTPTISPDGTKIAMAYSPDPEVGFGEIWIYGVEQGGTFSPFTTEGFNAVPFWSPDGREVGFLSDRDSPGSNAIFAGPWDESEPVRLVRAVPGQSVWDALWTPDGQVVHRQGTGALGENLGIYVGAAHPDSAASVVVDTESAEYSPSVSPNGRWLAYQSNQSGRYEIYVQPIPSPGPRTQVSLRGGIRPIWAHNGREIFYWSGDSLAVASVREDPTFVVESRERFASASDLVRPSAQRPYDVALDDQRLLALGRV